MKILSFNIRYPEPTDGDNIWDLRKEAVAETIRASDAYAVGLQEPEIEQLQYLDRALPEYSRLGVSRYGNEVEKFTAILYRRDRLRVLDHGAYWFSTTPDVPASMDWLIHKPYAVNWARFACLDGTEFTHYNTHFPYKPEQAEARLHSARLMVARAVGERVILTGDFNSVAGSEVYQILTAAFEDAFITAADRHGPEGTFHGFSGVAPPGRRIDWILYRGNFEVERFVTLAEPVLGRQASDHFGVLAQFRT
jgi:endonuclease/exonuclease/phosphatase family metal-dependent hydrolase